LSHGTWYTSLPVSVTVRPGSEPPWWLEEAPPDPIAPALEGELRVDVAVVGGGYTGLWTALALRERDPTVSVAVLEARFCGWGPSGRNGGFLHGYWASLARLRDRLGSDDALTLARAGDAIVPAIRAFAESRGEDVWLREAGILLVSTTRAQDAAVERALATARELGVDEEAIPLSAVELAERCRSPAFRRGVHFREGGTVQPARLVRALRRAALNAGVALHERTPVLRAREGALATPRGRVRADAVVLAVNAAATGWRPLAGHLTNFGSYVVLTEPVPDLLEEIGWTGGEAIVDGRMFLHYFRTTADGRVVMGSGSGPIGLGGRIDERFFADRPTGARAEAGLRRLLPALARARVERAWGGPIDVSADQYPFVGSLPGRRVHYAAGYSGNGVGPSWLCGQALASVVLGRDDEWSRLPFVGRRPPGLPPEPLKRLGGGLIRAAALACEEADERGRRAPLAARATAAIPRLLGVPLGRR
jgi:glycine/D-amino acid oxidase-like deaminating enzyme